MLRPSSSRFSQRLASCIRSFPLTADNIWCLEGTVPSVCDCLSLKVMEDILSALTSLPHFSDDSDACCGIVLNNTESKCFLSNFDPKMIRCPDRAAFMRYWSTYQEMFVKLQTFPVPVTCVTSRAEGMADLTLMAACDFVAGIHAPFPFVDSSRLIARLPVSPWMAGALCHRVGFRWTERILTTGTQLSFSQSRDCQMIDSVVSDADVGVAACLTYIREIHQHPSPFPFWVIKDRMRSSTVAPLCTPSLRELDSDINFENMTLKHIQEHLDTS